MAKKTTKPKDNKYLIDRFTSNGYGIVPKKSKKKGK